MIARDADRDPGRGRDRSIVAAFFARAGHETTLTAHGEHLRATHERGIRVTGPADFSTPVAVAERADGLGVDVPNLRLWCDLVRARAAAA
jgi:hypothetical protein